MNVFYRKQILQSQWLIVLIQLHFFSLLTRQWSFRINFFCSEIWMKWNVLWVYWCSVDTFKAGVFTRLCFDSFWKIFFLEFLLNLRIVGQWIWLENVAGRVLIRFDSKFEGITSYFLQFGTIYQTPSVASRKILTVNKTRNKKERRTAENNSKTES